MSSVGVWCWSDCHKLINSSIGTQQRQRTSSRFTCNMSLFAERSVLVGWYEHTYIYERRAQLCEHFFSQIEQPQHKLHKLLPKANTTTHNNNVCLYHVSLFYLLPRAKIKRTKNCFIKWRFFKPKNSVTLLKTTFMSIWICVCVCVCASACVCVFMYKCTCMNHIYIYKDNIIVML